MRQRVERKLRKLDRLGSCVLRWSTPSQISLGTPLVRYVVAPTLGRLSPLSMPGQDPVLPTCHPSTPPHLSALDRVTLENTRNSQVYTPPPFTSNACTNSSEEEEGEAELFDQLHDETEDDQPITPDLVRIAVVAGLGGELDNSPSSLPSHRAEPPGSFFAGLLL